MSIVSFNHNFPSFIEKFLNNEDYHHKHNKSFDSLPKVNVLEDKESYKLELAAPGLKKENFKLKVHEQRLTISASQQINKEEISGENIVNKFIRKEFEYNNFQRSFVLPKTIDFENIEAVYLDGILQITLKKLEESKVKEPVEIAVA